ncbi:hypothetical protein SeseC_00240 [Streptococcus equi subsp. zooepidemicus ATCC 35246]|nr:hypothetical protein SeseC_00240 [Streptococcus equi subsp. zooepidemicus ATCC 35246]
MPKAGLIACLVNIKAVLSPAQAAIIKQAVHLYCLACKYII